MQITKIESMQTKSKKAQSLFGSGIIGTILWIVFIIIGIAAVTALVLWLT